MHLGIWEYLLMKHYLKQVIWNIKQLPMPFILYAVVIIKSDCTWWISKVQFKGGNDFKNMFYKGISTETEKKIIISQRNPAFAVFKKRDYIIAKAIIALLLKDLSLKFLLLKEIHEP